MADKDPFTFESDSDDDCFQAWSGSKVVVTNLNPSPYTPVVETVKKVDVKERKVTPSPKRRSNGKRSFFGENERKKFKGAQVTD